LRNCGILETVTDLPLRLRSQSTGSGPTCRQVLGVLPGWFGIEQSVEDYVAVADRAPTVVASVDGNDIGFLTAVRHSPYTSEIYVEMRRDRPVVLDGVARGEEIALCRQLADEEGGPKLLLANRVFRFGSPPSEDRGTTTLDPWLALAHLGIT
jgi:hypothetical protein